MSNRGRIDDDDAAAAAEAFVLGEVRPDLGIMATGYARDDRTVGGRVPRTGAGLCGTLLQGEDVVDAVDDDLELQVVVANPWANCSSVVFSAGIGYQESCSSVNSSCS